MLPPTVRIFVAAGRIDFRNGFDGLAAVVRETLGRDPLSGDLFVFGNKRADRLKILFASRQGLCLFYKRIERGVFRFPKADAKVLEIESAELAVLLEGLELAKRRPVERRRAAIALG